MTPRCSNCNDTIPCYCQQQTDYDEFVAKEYEQHLLENGN